ncbi:MAG: hypothetical protein ACFFD8_01575 [Candidatus Thorarchaeota archaeon]
MESNTVALIKEAGQQGILLAELAQQIGKVETSLLKVIDSLTAEGHVKKIEEQQDGKPVIRVVWLDHDEGEWDTLQGCPCFICQDIEQCGTGQPISPLNCDKLNCWIKNRTD